MKHPLLDPHHSIAWDADKTLVHGPNSQYFCDYIRANPEKKHFIVTFRDPEWAAQVFKDLMPYGLATQHFVSVSACPPDLETAYSIRRFFLDPVAVDSYVTWKGKIAKELGCTVLIDDMPEMVLPGCHKYGIMFHHAHKDFP